MDEFLACSGAEIREGARKLRDQRNVGDFRRWKDRDA
jgi:hypothetical protein